MSTRLSGTDLLLMIAGLAIWGVAFNALYGFQALGCARGWHLIPLGPSSLHRAVLVGLLIGFVALHAVHTRWECRRRTGAACSSGSSRLVRTAALALAWTGLAATLVTGGPVTGLTMCAA